LPVMQDKANQCVPTEVQEKLSCRGFGGVPQFSFLLPPRLGAKGLMAMGR
jgi:hypothetical protein